MKKGKKKATLFQFQVVDLFLDPVCPQLKLKVMQYCKTYLSIYLECTYLKIPDNKNNGQNAYHHRSLWEFIWQLTLISITIIPRRLNPGKRPSFLVSYKYSIKTITVLELKDVLVPEGL